MTDWQRLDRELSAWKDAGYRARFWWRDDDCVAVTDALSRLMELARQNAAHIALAVIPKTVSPSLGRHIRAIETAHVLQHGYAHINHRKGAPHAGELGPNRPVNLIACELKTGFDRLSSLFGRDFLPVLVPPWNTIPSEVVELLRGLGFRGLSAFADAHLSGSAQVIVSNSHIDPIKWNPTPHFRGEGRCLDDVVERLKYLREEGVWDREHVGLLTHHLDHDEDTWRFVEEFSDFVSRHGSAVWCHPREIFGL